ncbi:hypothetical protein HY970_02070 [Candidatus Kaiserbacteria bacterium]|nr:hypothetical protein [Candidatus Kaiserbacteria bacterium]
MRFTLVTFVFFVVICLFSFTGLIAYSMVMYGMPYDDAHRITSQVLLAASFAKKALLMFVLGGLAYGCTWWTYRHS